VVSGTFASSARCTIGASVPSMSQNTATSRGTSVSGWRTSASFSAVGADTGRSMPRVSKRVVRLGVIGTVAGAFSGLFGIGGGTVIVPLLILWLAYEEREATGTSLAAIVIIAALGALLNGLFGNVDVSKGVLIGIPAVFGVVVGTALQQRVPVRVLNGIFAVLMVVSAALLVF
jgi:uncharacterized protein